MASRAPCDPTALAERFLDARRSGSRLSIDGLLDSSDIHADREATRAEVVRILGRRLRESTGQRPMLPQGDPALPAGSSGAGPGLTPAHVPPPELPGYEIIDLIGRGGMGVVWEAYQTATGRRVAVKFLNDSSASTEMARQRFEREVELLARLQHPNIVSIVDSGVHSGRYFYAMDYVEGRPLDEALAPGSCDVRQALELMATIAEAVDFAHQRGVLHRDLKPGNILVVDDESSASAVRAATGEPTRANAATKAGAAGRERSSLDERQPLPYGRGSDRALNPQPKVLDFGLAKAMDPGHAGSSVYQASLSEPGQLLGTLAYMPPEQSRGRLAEMSVRSDVYALGAVAYELLTGRLPVAIDGALGDVLARIANQDPPIPSSVRPSLSADIDAILLKALQKSPERRYATAAEFTADIRRFLSDQPVLARPDTFAYRARKFVRRNKLAVSFASSVFALLAGFGVWMSVLYTRAEDRRKETEQVADFQARMLSEIDVEAMGRGVVRHLREQVKAGLERESVGEWPNRRKRTDEEVATALKRFDEAIGPGHPVDVARQVMDEYVLRRAGEAVEGEYQGQPLVEAAIRSAIGETYQAMGLYAAAEHHLRAAVELLRSELGEDHPNVAYGLANLASLFDDKGDYLAAEPLSREALAIRRRKYGNDHPDVARSLNNLGVLLKQKGDYIGAEPLLQEALAIRQRILGDDHEEVATSLNNLALLLHEMGDYTRAEPLYRNALASLRKLFGEHIYVASAMDNLAALLSKKGDYASAEALCRDGLAMRRRLLGNEHPQVAISLNNLADLLGTKGDYEAAEQLLRDALTLQRKALGDGHPTVAIYLSNLSGLLRTKGDYASAEILVREALAIQRVQLSDEHPSVALSLTSLGALLKSKGDYSGAETSCREALDMRRRLLGGEHPDVAMSVLGLANVLKAKNDLKAAEPLFREALAIALKVHGSENSEIAIYLFGLAMLLNDKGEHAAAEPLLRKALALDTTKLPPGHYELSLPRGLLGAALTGLKRYEESEAELRATWELLLNDQRSPQKYKRKTLQRLVALYTAWGKPKEASEYGALLAATSQPTSSPAATPILPTPTNPIARSR